MATIIGTVLIGVLALLSIHEIIHYGRARLDPEQIEYPRRRLSRRLSITLLFIALMLLVMFWPQQVSPAVQLTLMLLVLVGIVIGIVLLFRDLHETSTSVVAHASRLDREASQELRDFFDKHPPDRIANRNKRAQATQKKRSSEKDPRNDNPPHK